MSATRVRVTKVGGGFTTIVTTDRAGNATLRLAPGRYYAAFADLQGFDGKGGDLTCSLGERRTRAVHVSARGITDLEIGCGEP